jgi:N-acetylmuramoyl-L-alanine amidase
MTFKNGILKGVAYHKAQWMGGEITPEVVVLHDTAGRLTKGNSARYLQNNDSKVSVHFVIERDGSLEQQVPVNRRANHAGKSNYHGRKNCNDFSIGIELVNPGRLTPNNLTATAWYGLAFDVREFDLQLADTPHHGRGMWVPYTEEQIETLINLLRDLFRSYETLSDITTHWYISPGRKVDTNPLFPLKHVRALILGRDDPLDVHAEDNSKAAPNDAFVQIDTPNDALNLRRWPSFNPNVMAAIPDGTVVPVLRQGTFEGRKWLCVFYDGREGWIVASYTAHFFAQEPIK